MLINCPECSRNLSDKADCCPHCGHPIYKLKVQQRRQKQAKTTKITLLVLAIIGLYIFNLSQRNWEKKQSEVQNYLLHLEMHEPEKLPKTSLKHPDNQAQMKRLQELMKKEYLTPTEQAEYQKLLEVYVRGY